MYGILCRLVGIYFFVSLFTSLFVACWASPPMLACPEWEGAVYVNGKCFKQILMAEEIDWYSAQDYCTSHWPDAILAEPRSVDEIELFLSPNFMASSRGWTGLIKNVSATSFHFYSDNALMSFTDYVDPGDVVCTSRPCCLRSFPASNLFRDFKCRDMQGYPVCERAIPERYLIFLADLQRNTSLNSSEIFLEVMVNQTDIEVQVAIFHLNSGILEASYIHVNDGVNGRAVDINMTEFVSDNSSLSNVIEVASFQHMTVTLVYQRDTPVALLRTFLLPSFGDLIDDISNDKTVSFILVSTNFDPDQELHIVAGMSGGTEVSITFNTYETQDNYVVVNSSTIWNVKSITMTVYPYQCLNVWANSLDGIHIWAPYRIAVYVTSYEEKPVDRFLLNNVYQAIPLLAASTEYVTVWFPNTSSWIGYKIVAIYNDTIVQYESGSMSLPEARTVMYIFLPNGAFLLSGNKPFQVYRTFMTADITDNCFTPLVPRKLWSTEFTVSSQWMRSVESVHMHFVCNTTLEEEFPILDQDEQCEHVKGSVDLIVCNLPLCKDTIDLWEFGYTVKFKGACAAYFSWTEFGTIRCQPIGYGNQWIEPVEEPETSTVQTTSSTSPTPTTSTTSPTPTTSTTSPTPTTSTTSPTPPTSTTSPTPTTSTTSPTPTTSTTSPTPTTSSTSPTPPTSTTPFTPSSTACPTVSTPRTNLTSTEIDEAVEKIQKELKVDAKKTSTFIRTKTSAKDSRTSSESIGYFGIAFVVIIFGSIIAADVITFSSTFSDILKRANADSVIVEDL